MKKKPTPSQLRALKQQERRVAERRSNPKTLMGSQKLPMLSVIPTTALIYLGRAMRNGAYESPRKDGSLGYGPYNWRDQPIEAMIYVDAAIRHIAQYVDGEDVDEVSKVEHIAHAMATLAILADAIENQVVIDDRPRVRSKQFTRLLIQSKRTS